jgi:MinD-like ATPase involved in chromosome partitioning or flagellar assembly
MPSPDRNRILWCTPGVANERLLIDSVRAAEWTVSRECIDAADVLAAVSIEPESVAVVSTAIQRVDAALWGELCARAARVVVVRAPGESGIPHSSTHAEAAHIEAEPTMLLEALSHLTSPNVEVPDRLRAEARGTVIAVWGTSGAPGRSTIAIALSEACARLGLRTLVVDGDTHGPSIATSLAITEQASGVLLACKHAEQGSLDTGAMERAMRNLKPGLDVLTGLDDPVRWAEVRGQAFARVMYACRAIADITVVDVHSCIESTSDPVTGMRGERNGITRVTLAEADHVVVVSRPDPVGVARLVRSLAEVGEVAGDQRPHVVVNRVQRAWEIREVRQVLSRTGFAMDVEGVPEDSTVTRAAARGSLLSEIRARSSAQSSVRSLARRLVAA